MTFIIIITIFISISIIIFIVVVNIVNLIITRGILYAGSSGSRFMRPLKTRLLGISKKKPFGIDTSLRVWDGRSFRSRRSNNIGSP